jgi:hypothetical protein
MHATRLTLSMFLLCPAVAAFGESLAWTLPDIADAAVQTRADRLYVATQRLAHHLLSELHGWTDDPTMLLLTDSKSGEHWVRPNAGTAAGLAFIYRFGAYDERIVGLPREELLKTKLVPMLRYLVTTHVTGSRPTSDGKKWGDAWQSAHWADSIGMAAWWAGADLPADLAADVRRVVAHEADRFVGAVPPHQLRNDTKAEENAWNCKILSVAILLMPDDARRPAWEAAFGKWALSAWLRPADEQSAEIIDGRPLSQQFTGANIYDDFTLENHHIVHPDYMTAWSLSAGSSLEFALTHRKLPQALLHNVAGVYENLKWFCMPDGGFAYPSGQDWALFRQVDWLYPNTVAAVFGDDPEGWVLLDRSLDVLDKMQARAPGGAIYQPGENFFASGQTDKLCQFSRAWLSLHFAKSHEPKLRPRMGVRRLDNAKILLNRTPSSVHAFCWGTRTMAQCMPMQLDRMISPHERSGVGYVKVPGRVEPLEIKLVDVKIESDDASFNVVVTIDHGDVVRAHLRFRSNSDGSFIMQERLVAAKDVATSEIATGLIGILNNKQWIYERGEREVMLGDSSARMASCSGEVSNGAAVRQVAIDSVLRIASDRPLTARYAGADRPARSRVTDELSLNCIEGNRTWTPGQVISEWEATIRCTPREQK